jgi:HD-like signal output (HDOD) protein
MIGFGQPTTHDMEQWVKFLSSTEIPVLKTTADAMQLLVADEDKLSARAISTLVVQDPMMTFRLLRYSQTHKPHSQTLDLMTAEQAILMMGTTSFFRNLPVGLLVQEVLKDNLIAQVYLLKLINRSQRAARFAGDWATLLHNLHAEEVYVATLLHDLAEMLLLCFSPSSMCEIYALQLKDKTLRSHDAQLQVLGFKMADLQSALCVACQLPPLLSELMKMSDVNDKRVLCVNLAVNLARHSAISWGDAALPDDFRDIAELLRVDVDKVMRMVGAPLRKNT